MGRGQRHSKNAGIMGSEALTYHERKALGFGTVKERVGKVCCVLAQMGCSSGCRVCLCSRVTSNVPVSLSKLWIMPLQDSQGNYYDCCLTLQPAVVSRAEHHAAALAGGCNVQHIAGKRFTTCSAYVRSRMVRTYDLVCIAAAGPCCDTRWLCVQQRSHPREPAAAEESN